MTLERTNCSKLAYCVDSTPDKWATNGQSLSCLEVGRRGYKLQATPMQLEDAGGSGFHCSAGNDACLH